ncbi:hypothetical protein HRG_012831 [Hirsutella rhossiliensis]
MDDSHCVPPIVSFTGIIVDTGHSLLRRDLLPGLDAAKFSCCAFVRLSTYVAAGMPNRIPFKGFHPFVVFPIRANPWATLCKKMAERRVSQLSCQHSAASVLLSLKPELIWLDQGLRIATTVDRFRSENNII